jgi:hypothetical protein
MRLSAEQRLAAKHLFVAGEELVEALKPPLDAANLEHALAEVLAYGRLAAEALGLDAARMTKRYKALLSEDLL